MGLEAPCFGGGLSGNCLPIFHIIFEFILIPKSNIFYFFQNFKLPPTNSCTLKTFEKSFKILKKIIELRTPT